ncbi:hypothetical protein K466DRAFT_666166 [Polyporus arcularius HHB13444]|uniref:DUF6533 domain-containing protein n=1 Tax=Polyporus arcularius HHB13444 TaxID=1314778 RepID=A0A5C3NZY7_9APHY|nr:hypothetical protein K466DRAFT_666166 [Polyporus arcularius HHB13444]
MSSEADAAAATVDLFDRIYTGNYCIMATTVLFIYDTFLTFGREVGLFWTAKRISGASLLFYANKWIYMAYYVMGLVQFASFPSDKRFACSVFVIAEQAVALLQFIPGAVFSALRAYVLSRSKPLGLLVFALSLAPVGANSVIVIISRVPLVAADMILIYITWTKLRGWATLTDIRQSKRLALSDILLRGGMSRARIICSEYTGIIYFAILFVLNTLHPIFSATGVADQGASSYVTEFSAPLTTIIISRFLLELQEANQMVVRLDSDDPLHSSRGLYDSTPSFISSLGGFINPDRLVRSDGDTLDSQSSSEPPEEEYMAQAELPQAAVSSSSA